jgi:hypothetical protein
MQHRHDANREISRDATGNLEKADGPDIAERFCEARYQSASAIMYSIPVRTV